MTCNMSHHQGLSQVQVIHLVVDDYIKYDLWHESSPSLSQVQVIHLVVNNILNMTCNMSHHQVIVQVIHFVVAIISNMSCNMSHHQGLIQV